MKLLFTLRSPALEPYYETIVRALKKRGHTVEVLFDPRWSHDGPFFEQRNFVSRYLGDVIRELRSYRRYLVVSQQSDYYRRRWRRYLPFLLRFFVRIPGINAALASDVSGKFFEWFENSLSPAANILLSLSKNRPDVVLAAPLNMRFSGEVEYVKAAKSLGIPTVMAVCSWDNLTTKGFIHARPDLVLAWNDVQRKEAMAHHNIPERSIQVAGAFFFDKWFNSRHRTPRDIFCKRYNLDSQKPFVLYLASSRNIAHNEVWLIEKLREALNDAGLTDMQILVRPHPANTRPYEHLQCPGITVPAPAHAVPSNEDALQILYDLLMHSVAAIGINTSAMLDAICLDRPVVSVLAKEYSETQKEAAHFAALRESGAIEVVESPNECVQAIQNIVRGHDSQKRGRLNFVARWIRPQGRSAGEAAADMIESLVHNDHGKRHSS